MLATSWLQRYEQSNDITSQQCKPNQELPSYIRHWTLTLYVNQSIVTDRPPCFFLRISQDLLTVLASTCILFRSNLITFADYTETIFTDRWLCCLLCHCGPLCHSEDLYFFLISLLNIPILPDGWFWCVFRRRPGGDPRLLLRTS